MTKVHKGQIKKINFGPPKLATKTAGRTAYLGRARTSQQHAILIQFVHLSFGVDLGDEGEEGEEGEGQGQEGQEEEGDGSESGEFTLSTESGEDKFPESIERRRSCQRKGRKRVDTIIQ